MKRRHLLKSVMALIAAHPLANAADSSADANLASKSEPLPVLFIGHGSPMNVLRNTPFTQHLTRLGQELPRPRAILVVSAHWVAGESLLSSSANPETIYDFGGFPKELYEVSYPSPGAPELANQVAGNLKTASGQLDTERGLDHGAWSVLHHLYPKADIPVIQLAMSTQLSLPEHVLLASELRELRKQGVLILASGNIVHNLRTTDHSPDAVTPDWASGFDTLIRDALLQRDMPALLGQDSAKHPLWQMAHPTLEHYVPLLYAVGAAGEQDEISFPFEGFEANTLSMRSVRFG